ncbi:MAG: ABC transporter permease [Parvibaculaceae bacterium]
MSAVEKATAAPPATLSRPSFRLAQERPLTGLLWGLASVGLFAGVWEICWALGWANPMLLPPPHIFLADFLAQGRFFDRSTRIGHPTNLAIMVAVLKTVGISTARVIAGLVIAFFGSLAVGLAIRYFSTLGKLVTPMVNMLAPISPVAWLPVAIVIFGTGNAPAVFLVFISLFFIMTLATLRLIDQVPRAYRNVARIMGANRRQMFTQVIIPAILPPLFVVLRLNMFAAWMMLLIAESAGVGSGLGLVVMTSRGTFNSQLAFFTMAVIGIVGFALDVALRRLQARLLHWTADTRN